MAKHANAQRAILLQLLREDHDPAWSVADLKEAVAEHKRVRVKDALTELAKRDAVQIQGDRVRATACSRHIDELGLIGV
jgi:hypothetical protein